MKQWRWTATGTTVLFCAACALIQSPAERAHDIINNAGFCSVALPDPELRAYLRSRDEGVVASRRLTIYIESDGAPWASADQAPRDPTPVKPLLIKMASADPSAKVAYLGRPCQHLEAPRLRLCDPALWTHGRYSEQAVSILDRAVDALKLASGAHEIALVGYSGGGAMAALLAARRSDLSCLVSVAAPLDTGAWTSAIAVSPLRTSLNPADHAAALKNLKQTHFTGNRDTTVPRRTISAYVAQIPGAQVIDRPDFDHECCWAQDWLELRRETCLAGP